MKPRSKSLDVAWFVETIGERRRRARARASARRADRRSATGSASALFGPTRRQASRAIRDRARDARSRPRAAKNALGTTRKAQGRRGRSASARRAAQARAAIASRRSVADQTPFVPARPQAPARGAQDLVGEGRCPERHGEVTLRARAGRPRRRDRSLLSRASLRGACRSGRLSGRSCRRSSREPDRRLRRAPRHRDARRPLERPDRVRRVLGALPVQRPGAARRIGLAAGRPLHRRSGTAPARGKPGRCASSRRSSTSSSIHYDAVGSSERCFRALHDNRGLSAHFLLDLDGTLYQTLDLRERAFHAKDANDESIGIEIANIGAMSTPKLLQQWYGRDETGAIRNLFPARAAPRRAAAARRHPAARASGAGRGTIHGSKFVQYDFTDEQYDALARLLAGLSRAFPRIRLEAPRDRRGRVPAGVPRRGRRSIVRGHRRSSPPRRARSSTRVRRSTGSACSPTLARNSRREAARARRPSGARPLYPRERVEAARPA